MDIKQQYARFVTSLTSAHGHVDNLQILGLILRYVYENTEDIVTSHSIIDVNKKYILVDLGNVHDVLQVFDRRCDDLSIYAFADKCFNGYGVNPPSTRATLIIATASYENK